MPAKEKRIRGKTLRLLSGHYVTKAQATKIAKIRRHRGFKYVSVAKEHDGWAVYGL